MFEVRANGLNDQPYPGAINVVRVVHIITSYHLLLETPVPSSIPPSVLSSVPPSLFWRAQSEA